MKISVKIKFAELSSLPGSPVYRHCRSTNVNLIKEADLRAFVFVTTLFLLAGSVVAIKVIFHLREHGVDDEFSRVSCIVACLWMANVVAFIALHGDSEYAMKTFSLQAGLLITCQYMLRDRLREQQPEQPELE